MSYINIFALYFHRNLDPREQEAPINLAMWILVKMKKVGPKPTVNIIFCLALFKK
jgi:hypothetical protein